MGASKNRISSLPRRREPSQINKPDFRLRGKDEFFHDRKTQDAVIRNLEVIGQAVKDLGTGSLVSSHPDTPWVQIAATRNFLAHQYLGVDLALIWNIVEQHLPELRKQIAEIAKNEGVNLDAPDTPKIPESPK